MNKLFSKIAALSVGLAMAVGVGVALGHESVREAKAEDTIVFNTTSSQITATGSDKTITVSGVTLTFSSITAIDASYVQNAKNATITSTEVPDSITSIKIYDCQTTSTKTDGSFTVYGGTSASSINTEIEEVTGLSSTASNKEVIFSGSYTYFKVVVGSARVLKHSKIDVVYGSSSTGPFTVTYDANGGSGSSISDPNSPYESGSTVTVLSNSYTKQDYEFVSWNTKDDGTGTSYVSGDTFEIAKNTTLYAQWEYAGSGSKYNPYTVAQARSAIDAAGSSTLSDRYVSGIICQIDSYNSKYSSITYWISDDGTTTNMLEVYSGKGIGGADFSGVGDLTLKYSVVVKGNLKKYNSTYEFDVSSEIISYTAPVVVSVDSVKSAPSEVYVGQSVLLSDVVLNVTMSGGTSSEINPTSIVLDTSVAATGVVGKAYYEEVGYAEFVIDVIAVDFSGTHILKSNTTDYEANLDNTKFHNLIDNSAAFNASGISNVRLGGSPNTSDIMLGSTDSTGGSWTLTAPEGYVITTVVFTGYPSKSGGANLTVGGIQRTVTSTTYADQSFYVLGQSVQMVTSSRFWTSEISITLEKVTTGSVALAFGTAALAMTAEECAAGAVTEGTWTEVKTVFQHVDADFHSEAELVSPLNSVCYIDIRL